MVKVYDLAKYRTYRITKRHYDNRCVETSKIEDPAVAEAAYRQLVNLEARLKQMEREHFLFSDE